MPAPARAQYSTSSTHIGSISLNLRLSSTNAWPEGKRILVDFDPCLVDFNQGLAEIHQILTQVRPTPIKIEPNSTTFGRFAPIIGRARPKFGRIRPLWPSSAELGRSRTTADPDVADSDQSWGDVGQTWWRSLKLGWFRPNLGGGRPHLGQNQSVVEIGTNFGQTSADVDQPFQPSRPNLVELGRNRPIPSECGDEPAGAIAPARAPCAVTAMRRRTSPAGLDFGLPPWERTSWTKLRLDGSCK